MFPYFENLSNNKKEKITQHLELVMKANESLNITRINGMEEGMLLHVEDSLSALPEIESAPEGLLGDMGSGAGYPGIPLAIATGRSALLIDAREKKMRAVEEMISVMGIKDQVSVYSGRAELLARTNSGVFSVLTARALSKISVLLELASPLLKQGGYLVCYKSHIDEEEWEDAQRVQPMVGMKYVSHREFVLGGEYTRCIYVFKRQGKAKVKLPRLEGMAQKKPL